MNKAIYDRATKNMALKSRALIYLLMNGWESSKLQGAKVSDVSQGLEDFYSPMDAIFRSDDDIAFAYPSKRPWPMSRILDITSAACRNAGVSTIEDLRGKF